MDAYLQARWDATTLRTVECRFYQSKAASALKRMQLTASGIELFHAVVTSADARGKSADVIPWPDILGAAVLTPEKQAAHVPGYRGKAMPKTDFVVFGCIPKANAIKNPLIASGLQVLSCFTGTGANDDVPDVNDKKRKRSSAPVGGKCDRIMVQWVFRYNVEEDADTFVPHVVHMIQRLADPRTAQCTEPEQEDERTRRKYLVLVNPVGGTGNARQAYYSIATPILEQSDIDCEVIVTKYQHHATEIAAEMPLNTYDCVVAVGGDGLLSEVLQGMMKRLDWNEAIKQPLGILPGGSGNGISATLLYRSGESFDLVNAAYALAKGTSQELDIASVVNGKDAVMYSFLSLEWAFMADVDIDSERYRMFGGMRFTMSAIARLLSKHKNYTGKVRYLSSEHDDEPPPKYHDRATLTDEIDAARPSLDVLNKSKANREVVDQVNGDEETQLETQDTKKRLASQGEWKELSGPFHMFWGVNVSHTGAQGHLAPNARIDDGYYYLLVVEGAYSRLNMTRMLFGLEDGTHVGKKQVQLIRTRAFTLHVDNPADRLCVDGELFDGPEVKL
uniref:DAGKc domain-containing protein n=1 Tax=Globisporangium ultimum (strain ATCC 200006 / CBS 805.95 / DAOM BR144) TaxID=431595 RepID=K3WTL1_GLOUD